MDKCCHSRLVSTPQRRLRNRRMPHHSKKKNTHTHTTQCKRSGRLLFSSSPPSTSSSSSRVPQQFEITSRRERRLIGSQPLELLICFWMTNGESWERDKQGQCDCSHETKGSLSPRLHYISVDNATALRTRGRTRAHAGPPRLGDEGEEEEEEEAINQTNSITAWRRKHSNR